MNALASLRTALRALSKNTLRSLLAMLGIDVGREAGYDGNCLVAFNVGADNGGRGVHTLQTDGLVALL